MFRTGFLSIIRSPVLYTQQYLYFIQVIHVELYSKNKFEKLVHLVGFIIRIISGAAFNSFQCVSPLTACTKYMNGGTTAVLNRS